MYYNIQRCTGDYIAVHHSDDIWQSDKLEKQVAYLDSHPEAAACFTWVQFIDEQGNEINPSSGNYTDDVFAQPNRNRFEWLSLFFYKSNKLCHPSILIRKECYLEYGMFAKGLGAIPDFTQWIRLCRNAEIHIIQERLTRFRLRDNAQNASAEKPSSIIRSDTEFYFILKEFLQIPEQDFCKVFPEALKYQTPKGIMVEYALAHLCLEADLPSHKLFGLETLYSLLNSPEKAAQIKEMYNFNHMDFIKLTDKHDIFKSIAPHQHLKCTLSLNLGNGFMKGEKIVQQEYLTSDGKFSVSFDLSAYTDVKAFRFCPQEGFFVCCRINGIKIDGQECIAKPICAKGQADGFDIFPTLHPMYYIEQFSSAKKLVITGKLYLIDKWKLPGLSIGSPAELNLTIEKKKILYGIGYYGEQALSYYGTDLVYAFADANKSDTVFYGKQVLHPSELPALSSQYEIVICVLAYDEVAEYLSNIGVTDFKLFDIIDEPVWR